MAGIEQAVVHQHGDQHASEGGGGDHEHDDDLVFHRLEGVFPRENLAGHHSGQGDESGDHHGIDDGDHAPAHGVRQRRACGFPARCAVGEFHFNLVAFVREGLQDLVEAQRYAGQGIAGSCPENQVLGFVPGFDLDDRSRDEDGRQPGAENERDNGAPGCRGAARPLDRRTLQ